MSQLLAKFSLAYTASATLRRLSLALGNAGSLALLIFSLSWSVHAGGLTVSVATTPLSTPFYVAEQLGYFAQEGLNITMKECVSGKLCLTQMLAGQSNFATASELPIMLNSFARKDFAILATFSTTNRDVKMIARKSAGMKTPKDFAGKKIALMRGTSGEYFTDLTLLTYGVDPRSVTIVDMNMEAVETALADRAIDAFAVFEPTAFRIMKALKNDGYVIATPPIYTLSFNLVGMKSSMGENSVEVAKLLRALDRAILYIRNNPDKAQAILLERLKLDSSFVDWTWAEYRFDLALNQSLLTTLESEARWAMRENFVNDKTLPNYLNLIDTSYLLKIKPASVTLVK